MFNQKGLSLIFILLGVLIIVVLGTGAYLYKGLSFANHLRKIDGAIIATKDPIPTPSNEINNWRTYTNTDYHYSVKYPNDWSVYDINALTYILPPESASTNDLLPDQNKSITIMVRDKNAPINPVFIEYKTIRKVKIEGAEVEVKQPIKPASSNYLAVYVIGNNVYTFEFGANLDKKYDQIFDQILSTFSLNNDR